MGFGARVATPITDVIADVSVIDRAQMSDTPHG